MILNTVKTMILVSVSFAVCWLPCQVYTLFQSFGTDANFSTAVYYVTIFVVFFSACLNPFIYAFNYEAVKKKLPQLAKFRMTGSVDQTPVITVRSIT
jgi:hypothetical protein